jgi:hypothetical protein
MLLSDNRRVVSPRSGIGWDHDIVGPRLRRLIASLNSGRWDRHCDPSL